MAEFAALFDSDEDDPDMRRAVEESQLSYAQQVSLIESEADKAHREAEERRMNEALAPYGAQRVYTARKGNCQFIALVETANLDIDHEELRQLVCNELVEHSARYRASVTAADYGGGSYEAYVATMRGDGAWGDHLTLQVAANVMMRPFRCVRVEGPPMQVDPHESIPRETWGDVITLAHYGEIHYETTSPL